MSETYYDAIAAELLPDVDGPYGDENGKAYYLPALAKDKRSAVAQRMRELAAEKDKQIAYWVESLVRLNAELAALKKVVTKAVHDEPEYPGDMPDEVWEIIQTAVYTADRNAVAEVMQASVRLTKRGILDRFAAKDAK